MYLQYTEWWQIQTGQHIFTHCGEKPFKDWDNISRWGKKNLTVRRWGKKSPWLWFWQLECFKLFSLLKRGSHISVWFMQKIYKHIELLKSFHICNLLNFLWKFHSKLQLLLLLEIKNNEGRPFKKFSLFLFSLMLTLPSLT